MEHVSANGGEWASGAARPRPVRRMVGLLLVFCLGVLAASPLEPGIGSLALAAQPSAVRPTGSPQLAVGNRPSGYEQEPTDEDLAPSAAFPSFCEPTDGWPSLSCPPPFCDQLWFRGEYLLWWTKALDVPLLVTTSPSGTPVSAAGVLGEPGTSVLVGGGGLAEPVHSGGRFTLGWWLDPGQCEGIEASYLGLGRQTARFRAASGDTPILARPYFDTVANSQAAVLVSYPNLLRGSIAVDATSELQSVEVLWRSRLATRCASRLDFLLGYRFARLEEGLTIGQSAQWLAQQGVIVPGTTLSLFDRFDTESQFHGVELGFAYCDRVGRLSLELLGKTSLGSSRSEVLIDGATRTRVPDGGEATFAGGLLAQETNMGRHAHDAFAVLPEVAVTLGYDLTSQLRTSVGYSFLYWPHAARPGEQIDLAASQLPPEPPTGAQRPAFHYTSSSFWAQGLRFGLDYRF